MSPESGPNAFEIPTLCEGDDLCGATGCCAIEELRQKPKPEVRKPRYHYDENEPLTLR